MCFLIFDRCLNKRINVTHKGKKIKKRSLLIFHLIESKSVLIISLKVTFFLLHMHVNIKKIYYGNRSFIG